MDSIRPNTGVGIFLGLVFVASLLGTPVICFSPGGDIWALGIRQQRVPR